MSKTNQLQQVTTVNSTHIPDAIKTLADEINRFIHGEEIHWNLSLFDFSHFSQFQKLVFDRLQNIPRGKITTYKRLAEKIGNPHAFRAVARTLATNPLPFILPCHRVIKSNGELGGYQGGLELKKRFLEFEGIKLKQIKQFIQ